MRKKAVLPSYTIGFNESEWKRSPEWLIHNGLWSVIISFIFFFKFVACATNTYNNDVLRS